MKNSERKLFAGLHTAIITPFLKDKSVDYLSFERILEEQIEAGVDGIVVLGTTGESATLNNDEHREITRKAVEIVRGRVLLIAGTGSNSTAKAIEHSKAAEACGVAGLLQVVPYYNKPTQKGIYEHFTAIADAVNVPMILYNIPGRTGVNMEADTAIRLAQNKKIIGIKEASSKFDQIKKIIDGTPDNFVVLSGNDDETMRIIQEGGDGVIAVTSNVIAKEVKYFVDLCLAKDWDAAQTLQDRLRPLFRDVFIETNPQPIKTLMAELGKCKEVFRLPLTTMHPDNKIKLMQTWSAVKNLPDGGMDVAGIDASA